ncbi:MAG: hypothetical protein WA708_17010 [Acidobacteriaceae bacterium]
MYLWKCWRDTRIKFFIFLGLFICLQLIFLFSPKGMESPVNPADLGKIFFGTLVAIGSVLLFLGWILGDENVGADIGRGSGDFLLTRPQTRGSLVWTGWALSMVEMIVLWIVFFAAVIGDILSQSTRWGISTATVFSALADFSAHGLPLMFLVFLINIGLIFGVTYCIGVVLRSGSRALIGTIALIVGYRILKTVFAFRFHISLPDILLSYPGSHPGLANPAVHDFVVRGLIAIAFPAIAHLLLERMEI